MNYFQFHGNGLRINSKEDLFHIIRLNSNDLLVKELGTDIVFESLPKSFIAESEIIFSIGEVLSLEGDMMVASLVKFRGMYYGIGSNSFGLSFENHIFKASADTMIEALKKNIMEYGIRALLSKQAFRKDILSLIEGHLIGVEA